MSTSSNDSLSLPFATAPVDVVVQGTPVQRLDLAVEKMADQSLTAYQLDYPRRVRSSCLKVPGTIGALWQLAIWGSLTYYMRTQDYYGAFMSTVAFYWVTFTVITGVWEFSLVLCNYHNVLALAADLIRKGENVWTGSFNVLSLMNPLTFAPVFYAEYGAHADREYMAPKNHKYLDIITTSDSWSRMIEGSHAIMCGLFCFVALLMRSDLLVVAGMSAQLMNSLLYQGCYLVQCYDSRSLNYFTTPGFTTGCLFTKRIFMWINIFWTIMPAYVIAVAVMANPGMCSAAQSAAETVPFLDDVVGTLATTMAP